MQETAQRMKVIRAALARAVAVDLCSFVPSSALGHRGGSAAAAADLDRRRSTTSPTSSTPQSERELERRIRALQQATGDVVVVATVPNVRAATPTSTNTRSRCSRTAAAASARRAKTTAR